MQGRLDRVIDAHDAIAAIAQTRGQLSQTHRAVEHSRTTRNFFDLGHDHRQTMLVPRSEHFGLRAPLMSRHRDYYRSSVGGQTFLSVRCSAKKRTDRNVCPPFITFGAYLLSA